MKTILLNVTGMKCVHCEAHVAEAVEAVNGVSKAIADHDRNLLMVRLEDDNTSVDAIKAAVEANPDHDYKVVGLAE